MNTILWCIWVVSANAFCMPSMRLHRFQYNVNRSLPLPSTSDLYQDTPSSVEPDITSSVNPEEEWEDGEVPWDLDELKNITVSAHPMKPTPFSNMNKPFLAMITGW